MPMPPLVGLLARMNTSPSLALPVSVCSRAMKTLVGAGTRSRVMEFVVSVVARGAATDQAPGAAAVLSPPEVVTTATGTVVVPPNG